MGILKVNKIDLNDAKAVNGLKQALQKLVSNRSSYYSLKFKPQYYFEVPNGPLSLERGWYVILAPDRKPIYVGKADDLNGRLNTNNGSIDNFANKQRISDPERNFIKRFMELDIFTELRVCIIQERDICLELNLDSNRLSKLDRSNIEKFINILRSHLSFL